LTVLKRIIFIAIYSEYMTRNPSVLEGSNPDGLARAKKGKYAFLMEASLLIAF
jgi:hypothetical protein